MLSFTKKEITATFLQLLEQKPLSKINVKTLVEASGISRNTFYYHYKDIWDLVDDIYNSQLEKVVSRNPVYGHWQEGWLQSLDYLQNHSMVVTNIFNSVKLETIKDYLYKKAQSLILAFSLETLKDRTVPPDELQFVVNFYSHALVGIFLDWIRGGMKEKPEDFVEMMGRLLNGSIHNILLCDALPPYNNE
jgi:AcrR family transcriptional regulator